MTQAGTMSTGPSAAPPSWQDIAEFLGFWLRENPLQGAERKAFDVYYGSYLRRFSPYMRHHFVDQTREISQLIRERRNPRLLEVGAGCGTESLWFALSGADVTGLDVATDRLAVARARHAWLEHRLDRPIKARFLEASLFDFTDPEPFDLVWMEQAYHHLEPREKVFETLNRMLNPGGAIVICEVNGWNLPLQAQFFMQRGWKTRTSFVAPDGRRIEYGNERITTSGALRRNLERAGFEVRSIRHFRLLPNSDPPSNWLSLEGRILAGAPFLSTHFNTVAVKPG
jgi:SAM-dependent methyltransferase